MISRYPMLPVTTTNMEELNTLDDDNVFPIQFALIAKEQAGNIKLHQQLLDNPGYTKKNLVNTTSFYVKVKLYFQIQPSIQFYNGIIQTLIILENNEPTLPSSINFMLPTWKRRSVTM
jgi:hypothetical protein